MNKLLQVIKKIISSTWYSIYGIKTVWATEHAFRLEIYVCLAVLPIIVWLPTTGIMKVLLGLMLLLLLTAELFNSAIEAVVDRVSLERHPLSKTAKDAGSAAVGIVIVMNIIVWIFTIWTM